MVRRFRSRPVEVEAIRYNSESCKRICKWIGIGHDSDDDQCGAAELLIPTPEGDEIAHPGDWIVRTARGVFHALCSEYFEESYEPVDGGGNE